MAKTEIKKLRISQSKENVFQNLHRIADLRVRDVKMRDGADPLRRDGEHTHPVTGKLLDQIRRSCNLRINLKKYLKF